MYKKKKAGPEVITQTQLGPMWQTMGGMASTVLNLGGGLAATFGKSAFAQSAKSAFHRGVSGAMAVTSSDAFQSSLERKRSPTGEAPKLGIFALRALKAAVSRFKRRKTSGQVLQEGATRVGFGDVVHAAVTAAQKGEGGEADPLTLPSEGADLRVSPVFRRPSELDVSSDVEETMVEPMSPMSEVSPKSTMSASSRWSPKSIMSSLGSTPKGRLK